MEQNTRKLNIMEDKTEDSSVEATHIMSNPQKGKQGMIIDNDDGIVLNSVWWVFVLLESV